MNKNVLIAFGGAILIALLVAVLMSAALKGGKKEKVKTASEVPRVQILVAAADIGTGALLTDENVKWKSWPEDAAFPGTITRKGKEALDEAAKGRTIRPIAMDEPVLETAIVSDEGGFLAAKLKPGMRAAAIKTSAASMVGGFINPGDFVDVVLTYRGDINARSSDPALEAEMSRIISMNFDRYASETILRNVQVLGIDQKAVKDEKTGAKVGKTVTLAVDERGAETLALAAEMGDLTLVLRALGDEDMADDGQPTVSDARLISIRKELEKEFRKVEQEAGSTRQNVRIYSGGQVTDLPTR